MLLQSSLLLTSVNILPILVGVGLGWGEGIHLSVTIMFLFLPLTYVSLSCLQNRWKSRSKARVVSCNHTARVFDTSLELWSLNSIQI